MEPAPHKHSRDVSYENQMHFKSPHLTLNSHWLSSGMIFFYCLRCNELFFSLCPTAALSDGRSNSILNGNFVVAMFKREINFKGTTIEYSGSDTKVERINCTERIEEELILQVYEEALLFSTGPSISVHLHLSHSFGLVQNMSVMSQRMA